MARLPGLHGEWDKTANRVINRCLTLHTGKEIASHLPYTEDYRVELQVFLRGYNTTNLSTPSPHK